MTGNLRVTAALADEIARGDLTVQPKPLSDKDTLGLSLQSMVERLRGVVADALSAADNVSSGSQELSSTSEQMSQGATEQAAAAEQASASMEEMAANIKQTADNAAQTEKIDHRRPSRRRGLRRKGDGGGARLLVPSQSRLCARPLSADHRASSVGQDPARA